MINQASERAVIGSAVAYLVLLAWSMANLSYDLWGVLVVAPVLAVLSVLTLPLVFSGAESHLRRVMYVGLGLKLAGVMARYWIGAEVYQSGDALLYHDNAATAARAVWSGQADVWSVVPDSTGTAFISDWTAMLYTLVGTSRLAGFVLYGFMAYWGIVLLIKAAITAVPGIASHRYAWLCMLAPSIVYWPSSIGKEAIMMLALGLVALAFSSVMTGRGMTVATVPGLSGVALAATIRPHILAIWLAGFFPGLVVAFVRGRAQRTPGRRTRGRGLFGIMIVAVGVGLVVAIQATIKYLPSDDSETGAGSLTSILEETTRRTGRGSQFTPPSIASPLNWPFAILRTLTRPLPGESASLVQHLAVLETLLFLGLCVLFWGSTSQAFRAFIRIPFIAFALTTVALSGLAYSSFANLGLLARQKSLVFPLLLLIPCLPEHVMKRKRRSSVEEGHRATADDRPEFSYSAEATHPFESTW